MAYSFQARFAPAFDRPVLICFPPSMSGVRCLDTPCSSKNASVCWKVEKGGVK